MDGGRGEPIADLGAMTCTQPYEERGITGAHQQGVQCFKKVAAVLWKVWHWHSDR
jgi:hypothetical protein